jgi:hypothetical protein
MQVYTPCGIPIRSLALAKEASQVISGPDYAEFLRQMYGNDPDSWDESLTGVDGIRFIVNVLTRMRFCSPSGTLNFNAKSSLNDGPIGFLPWFEIPNRRVQGSVDWFRSLVYRGMERIRIMWFVWIQVVFGVEDYRHLSSPIHLHISRVNGLHKQRLKHRLLLWSKSGFWNSSMLSVDQPSV